jgi:hypothetical protein
MKLSRNILGGRLSGWRGSPPSQTPRRTRRAELSWDCLEGRTVPSQVGGGFHHAIGIPSSYIGSSSSGSGASNTALSTALQTLQKDIQTIKSASNTTVGELTTIQSDFRTLANDGLSPSSRSALASFENSLVTAYASGTSLTDNSTLLSQFEALYTSSPTAQQTTDLTAAYNALAAAVTSAGINSTDLSTINTDWAAVLAAENSTSTETFPYFTLVTGGRVGGGCH